MPHPPKGYRPVCRTHGLWRHDTRPITFTLVVDDFRIKYVGKEHADHLLQALKQYYEVTEDWTGALYCGIKLEWNYDNKIVDLSMPG
jgi:endonuclease I